MAMDFIDIILMAEDLAGQWHNKKYQSGSTWYTIQDYHQR
jgi:hypothetical protein